MTGRVVDMEKDYIVYKFYKGDRALDRETDKFFKDNKIDRVPVVLIFSGGEVISRHEGVVEVDMILRDVKTKKDQKDDWYPDWLTF